MFSVTARCTDYHSTKWLLCLVGIWSTPGLVTSVRPPCVHPLHFSCSKLSNRCKSDPCVRIQYDISDSELALELTLKYWPQLWESGEHYTQKPIYAYHIQRMQHLEPADMCGRLGLILTPIWFVTFFHRPSSYYLLWSQQYKKLTFMRSW